MYMWTQVAGAAHREIRDWRLKCICPVRLLNVSFPVFRRCQSAPYRHHVTPPPRRRIKKRTDTSTSCHVSEHRALNTVMLMKVTDKAGVSVSVLFPACLCVVIKDIRQLTVKGSLRDLMTVTLFSFPSQTITPGCISHLWRESPTLTSSTPPL